MTYQELLEKLQSLTPEQLQDDVTVYLEWQEQYLAVNGYGTSFEGDVLDKRHLFLVVN